MTGTYRTGGLGVDIAEVNTAGERLIIARLRTVAEAATAHSEAMEHVLATTVTPA
ncbi:hypothetical protein ABT324_28115 [Saccharopolyspora sp. NPDC000359]|uniref:hypothetical protein n=1 Tax=Saccharopolyspora sp. NPDC000359 TaxID=3154251 RepID=UPI003327CC23